MKRFIAAALILVALPSIALTCAGAQTAEQAYYAACDAAIAQVKAVHDPAGPTDPTPQEAFAACDAIRADYDKQAEEAAQQPDADGKSASDRAGELTDMAAMLCEARPAAE